MEKIITCPQIFKFIFKKKNGNINAKLFNN